jgi:hypothetical protein
LQELPEAGGNRLQHRRGNTETGIVVQGTLKAFSDRGDSGKTVYRRFCPECGLPILSEADALPGIAIIKAGTLDDASWLKPGMEIFCDSAQPWVQLSGDRQRFPKMVPR